MYYIGLNVHKRKITYRVKDSRGKVHSGLLPATRFDLDCWMKTLPHGISAEDVFHLIEDRRPALGRLVFHFQRRAELLH